MVKHFMINKVKLSMSQFISSITALLEKDNSMEDELKVG